MTSPSTPPSAPAGLRAWGKRVRAEARGGNGEGILGWLRGAISAYTGCVTEKGPQRRWLPKLGKEGTQYCRCQNPEQSGRHAVEECMMLAERRERIEKGEMEAWGTRHSRDVGVEKVVEEEENGEFHL